VHQSRHQMHARQIATSLYNIDYGKREWRN